MRMRVGGWKPSRRVSNQSNPSSPTTFRKASLFSEAFCVLAKSNFVNDVPGLYKAHCTAITKNRRCDAKSLSYNNLTARHYLTNNTFHTQHSKDNREEGNHTTKRTSKCYMLTKQNGNNSHCDKLRAHQNNV